MRVKYLIKFHVIFTFSAAVTYAVYPQVQILSLNSLPYLGLAGNEENDETSQINSTNDLGATEKPKVVLLYLLFGPLLVNPEALKQLQIQIQKQKEQEPSKFSQASNSSNSDNSDNSNSVECYTRKGHEGNCTTFKECFPVEYYGEDNEMKPDHTALVDEMFTTSKSPGCVSRLNSVGDIERIICCPMSKKPSSLTDLANTAVNVNPVNATANNTELNSTMMENVPGEFGTPNSTVVTEAEDSFTIPEISTASSFISTNSSSSTEVTTMMSSSPTVSTTTKVYGENEEMTTSLPLDKNTTTTSTSTTTTTKRITTEIIPEGLSTLPTHCGRVKVYSAIKSYKITGGKEARRGEFPWMVAIFGKNKKQFCGGTLLNSQYVLTASHCLSTYNAYDIAHLSVTIGDHNIHTSNEGPHETRKISQIILHRGFEIKTYNNDVALMKLDRPVDFTEYIQPICLPKGNSSQNVDGYEVVVAGWGRERSYGLSVPTLRKVNIPIWKQSECQRVYNTFAPGRLTLRNICAGDGKRNKDACIGDSGGPLMQNLQGVWRQVGIVSWGKGCGSFPGVYTRVDQFIQWIEKNMR